MDGKHRGTGSASAAATEERRRKEKRRTQVNFVQKDARRKQRVNRGVENKSEGRSRVVGDKRRKRKSKLIKEGRAEGEELRE